MSCGENSAAKEASARLAKRKSNEKETVRKRLYQSYEEENSQRLAVKSC